LNKCKLLNHIKSTIIRDILDYVNDSNEYNLYIIHKISDEKYYLMISENIKYVHKLQNIYNDVFQIDLDINRLI